MLVFVVSVEKEYVYLAEPEKADELFWTTLNNLPQPMHPGVAQDLETFKEELKKYSK